MSTRQSKSRIEVGPARDWPALITQVAFVLSLGLVIARALMSETLREGFDVMPKGSASPRGPGPASSLLLDALCCLPALLVLARRVIDRNYILRWTWSQAAFGLLLLWAVLSVAWSTDKFATVVNAANILSAAALVWSTAQLVRSWLRLRIVAGVCLGLLLAYTAHGLIYRFMDVPDNISFWNKNKEQLLQERGWEPDSFSAKQFEKKLTGGEMIGFNLSPNSFAAVIVLLMVVSAGVAIQRRVNGDDMGWTLFIAVICLPALLALWFTNSRTAAGTLLIAGMSFIALSRLHPWIATRSVRTYWIVTGIVLLGAAALIGHGVYHGSLPQDSLNFRWRYWVASWHMLTTHPLLGVGWGNFGPHYLAARLPSAAEEVRDPHNFIVRAFAELGLIGGALVMIWLARSAWELTRPIVPSTPTATPQNKRYGFAVIVAAVGVGIGLNLLIAIDWSQNIDFLMLEVFRRMLSAGLICIGMVVATIRSTKDQTLDDRPAPWLLYAFLIGLGVFVIHNLMDFALAEAGALTLFAVVLGSAQGVRSPSATGQRKQRGVVIAILSVGGLAWMIGMTGIVFPVAEAEQRAFDGDEALRGSRPDQAAGLYRSAHQIIPYNADYAFRSARALILAGDNPEKVKAMLLIAIARNPADVMYYLTRANYELRSPAPDPSSVKRDYEAAVKLDPNNIQVRLDYADALKHFNDPAAAARQYRAALETNRQYDATEPKRLPEARVREIEQEIKGFEP